MNYYKKPTLIVLEGERLNFLDSLDPQDIDLLEGDFNESDIFYLNEKYPEFLGIWTTILKGAKKVGTGFFKRIGRRIRKRRKRRRLRKRGKARRSQQARIKAQQREIQILQYRRAQVAAIKKEKEKRNLLTMAAVALPVLFLLGQ